MAVNQRHKHKGAGSSPSVSQAEAAAARSKTPAQQLPSRPRHGASLDDRHAGSRRAALASAANRPGTYRSRHGRGTNRVGAGVTLLLVAAVVVGIPTSGSTTVPRDSVSSETNASSSPSLSSSAAPGSTLTTPAPYPLSGTVPSLARPGPTASTVPGTTPSLALPTTPPVPTVRPSSAANPPTVGGYALNNTQDTPLLGNTAGYQSVVLQDYMYADIARIKATNPNTKVMAYENAAITQGPNSCQYDKHMAAGVSYCYANAYHPEWFLLDRSGHRVVYADYPSYFAMDIGNPAYQSAWLKAVVSQDKRDGFDAVWLDDVNTHPGHGLDGTLQKYSDNQYGNAMARFIAAVAPGLRANGLLVDANVGVDPWNGAEMSKARAMAPYLSALNREFLVRWSSGPLFSDGLWRSTLDFMDTINATGTPITAICYGELSDTRAMRYFRATFLLGWSGLAGSAIFYRPTENTDPWSPEWTTDIGSPTDARYPVGTGWRRDFTGGTVVVDPSSRASQTFALGGKYIMPDGSAVTTVKLSPTTALVLRKSTT
jgi:Hypothetical glycosyl hydrolase family 15